ncbi:ABC transporter permease subunit [Streptomyces sp. NPDC018000]|uniref:ABC transporter permease subunit n=1 Tax=Streptomyces sp. NPDC018000 TaxID=3365028 RepID=UPI0037ADBB97
MAGPSSGRAPADDELSSCAREVDPVVPLVQPPLFAYRRNKRLPAAARNPSQLPYDAARSLLRMFVALAAATVFTFAYAYAAAKSRRLERILIPALDILQSVPVLGFLTVAVTGFIAPFPGSMLGLECASIFAIFTSQAWNMTFGFYHSLISLPRELDELSRSFRFTRWMRFWKVELPSGAIGLVWNGMMSFGGGWFFLVASEAISINDKDYALPGVGSYAGAAIADGDLIRVGWAIATMAVMVVGVNFLFWRPLTAWAERFKNEQSEATEVQRSVVLDFLRRSSWPQLLGRVLRPAGQVINRMGRIFGMDDRPLVFDSARRRTGDLVFTLSAGGLIAWGLFDLGRYIHDRTGLGVFGEPLLLGVATLARVIVLVVVATVIWVPVGVRIGFSPKLTRIAQPVVQVLASFPANFLFPLAVWFFLRTGGGEPARRTDGTVGVGPVPDPRHRVGHPQHRRSGPDGRPDRRTRLPPLRHHPGDLRGRPGPPARPRLRGLRRSHRPRLPHDDRTAQGDPAARPPRRHRAGQAHGRQHPPCPQPAAEPRRHPARRILP